MSANPFESICSDLAKLLWEKRQAYGKDNLTGAGEFLKLLYPNGMKPEQYTHALLLARMFDKMSRLANGANTEDPFADLAGYAICAIELEKR